MKLILIICFSFNSPYVYLNCNKNNKITEKNKINLTSITNTKTSYGKISFLNKKKPIQNHNY
ncbi:MAG: hypothetical protein DBW65_04875 [Alphaproteobacteria bacterium]|nr:MAG: hypothetical protein DBW65_04875 [Alphaproteobacteria bacterium]